MENHRIRLTASETGGLWANYIADSMFTCVYKYYLACVEDSEIKAVLAHALDLSEQHKKVTSDIFREEKGTRFQLALPLRMFIRMHQGCFQMNFSFSIPNKWQKEL
ncbi:hypothetical protein B9K06_06910 [Bacillus sp. OG2]|nr:hypothetical protein B9K06_06910 [Bacillus sp. OG2]